MRPLLKMRAWTERQGPGTNPYGGGGVWTDVLVNHPCSWWTQVGTERINAQRAVSIASEHIHFDRDADVRVGDRVRRLVDHTGRVVWDSMTGAGGLVREVEHVAVRREHLEAKLRSTI